MGHLRKIMVFLMVTTWGALALAAEPAIRIFPNPGDVVSADFLSDMFREVKPDLATTLIGTWTAMCWDNYTTDADAPGEGTLTVTSLTSITFTGLSCMARTSSIVTSGSDHDPVYNIVEIAALGNQAIFVTNYNDEGGLMGFTTTHRVASILQLEQNQITIAWPNSGGGSAGIEVLTRTNRVPAIPTRLAATATGTSVTLTWTDNSSDETTFRLLRRDSLTGTFTAIATPDANAVTYTDTGLTSGTTYWYRLQATNANGNSLGGNVVKVTIE